jgi:hypothetical protein
MAIVTTPKPSLSIYRATNTTRSFLYISPFRSLLLAWETVHDLNDINLVRGTSCILLYIGVDQVPIPLPITNPTNQF